MNFAQLCLDHPSSDSPGANSDVQADCRRFWTKSSMWQGMWGNGMAKGTGIFCSECWDGVRFIQIFEWNSFNIGQILNSVCFVSDVRSGEARKREGRLVCIIRFNGFVELAKFRRNWQWWMLEPRKSRLFDVSYAITPWVKETVLWQ